MIRDSKYSIVKTM